MDGVYKHAADQHKLVYEDSVKGLVSAMRDKGYTEDEIIRFANLVATSDEFVQWLKNELSQIQ